MSSIKKQGDWNRLAQDMHNSKKAMDYAVNRTLVRAAAYAHAAVIDIIVEQPSSWPALNEKYKAQKEKQGLSTNMLVATSSYFNSITTEVKKGVAFIGVNRRAVVKDGESAVEAYKVGTTHEFGYEPGNIPARPHFKPAYDKTQQWLEDSDILKKTFEKQLTRLRKRK